jgi:hypothetical protein
MLLIAEIILMVAAWRRGWKGWALLPIGIAMFVAFLLASGVAASGGSMQDVWGVALLGDLACIGALIAMVARPRNTELPGQVQEAALPSEGTQ